MDEEAMPMEIDEELVDNDPTLDTLADTVDRFLATACVDAVYGEPFEKGDYLIVPTAEVVAVMGIGLGSGNGPIEVEENKHKDTGGGSGGGAGGHVFSRPVAVIIASSEGVRVEPVVDVTKIALAALTAGGFMLGMLVKMLSRPKG